MEQEFDPVVEPVQDDAAQEQGAEKGGKTGDADRQAQFDKALGPRLRREREKGREEGERAARESVAPIQALAAWAEQLYPDQDIADVLLDREVARMVKDEGVSEAIARRLLKAEMGKPVKPEQKPAPKPDARLERLAEQMQDIKDEYGDDMAELLRDQEEILQQIADGRMDMYTARRMLKKPAPPVVRSPRGGAVPVKGIKEMTSRQIAELDKKLSSGEVFY